MGLNPSQDYSARRMDLQKCFEGFSLNTKEQTMVKTLIEIGDKVHQLLILGFDS